MQSFRSWKWHAEVNVDCDELTRFRSRSFGSANAATTFIAEVRLQAFANFCPSECWIIGFQAVWVAEYVVYFLQCNHLDYCTSDVTTARPAESM